KPARESGHRPEARPGDRSAGTRSVCPTPAAWIGNPENRDRANEPGLWRPPKDRALPPRKASPPVRTKRTKLIPSMTPKPLLSCRRWLTALFLTFWALLLGNLAHGAIPGEPLTLRCPTNIVLWTCNSNAVLQYPVPVPSGGCSNYQIICLPPPGTILPLGTTPVNCRVIDACQNVDTCTFTVTVMQDTEPPTIRCPENITLMACMDPAGACGRIVNYPPPLAKDNSGSVAVTCTPPSGTFFPCGNTIVTCVAEDRCGNKAR